MRQRIPEDERIRRAQEKRRRANARRLFLAKRQSAQQIRELEAGARAQAQRHEIDVEGFVDYVEEEIGLRPLERRISRVPEYGAPTEKARKCARAPIGFEVLPNPGAPAGEKP